VLSKGFGEILGSCYGSWEIGRNREKEGRHGRKEST